MKHHLLLTIVLFLALTSFSQSKFSLGFTAAYDQNSNHLVDLNKINTNEIPDFGAGANLIYYINDRMRLRAEAEYSNISFMRDYETDASVVKNIGVTKIAINDISLNPHFDYKLFSLSKLDLFASAGMRFEFTLTDWQRTYNRGGDLLGGKYLTDALNPGMIGGIGSVILKYNVTEHLGIQVVPEYTYFFRPLFGLNENNFQRMSLKAGVEWRF